MDLNSLEHSEANLERALILRETLHIIFDAVARSTPIQEAELKSLKTFYLETIDQASLMFLDKQVHWQIWGQNPQILVHSITLDAIDLLQSELVERLCYCQAEDCGWFFLILVVARTNAGAVLKVAATV